MDQNQLQSKVAEMLSSQASKDAIYKTLLAEGASVEQIENALEARSKKDSKLDLQQRTIQIIVTIAALLIGAGVFSFIASNWKSIGSTFKVIILLIAMLSAYLSGWKLKENSNYQKTGNALILLGYIIYGGSIFLIAQIFNIRANWPDGFLLWMIGGIAVALGSDVFGLNYLVLIVALIGLTGSSMIFTSYFGLIESATLFTSSILLVISSVALFYSGIKMRPKDLDKQV